MNDYFLQPSAPNHYFLGPESAAITILVLRRQLTGTTDPTGQALFTYTGTRGGGTDNLQAQATLSGMPTTSNVATVPWSGPINQAPVVNAGLPVTVTFPNTAVLSGSATDDGLPTPSSLTYSWSMLSGPGTVTFGAPNLASTTANFSIPELINCNSPSVTRCSPGSA